MKRILSCILTIAAIVLFASPAGAVGPLAAIPVGSTVTYRVTSESDAPETGSQSATHYVQFDRVAVTQMNVAIDGAPSGAITINSDGTPAISQQLMKPLKPFFELGLLMRGAPEPLADGAAWSTNLAIPIKDQTDNVPVVMSIVQEGSAGTSIVGRGSNDTSVQPGLRDFPATVTVTSNILLNAGQTLASATTSVSVAVRVGKIRDKTKNFGSSWTIQQVQ